MNMFLAEFKPTEFVNNLGKMGKGMLAIAIVMGIIILTTIALNKITSKKDKK